MRSGGAAADNRLAQAVRRVAGRRDPVRRVSERIDKVAGGPNQAEVGAELEAELACGPEPGSYLGNYPASYSLPSCCGV
jgi:hypothetical protein